MIFTTLLFFIASTLALPTREHFSHADLSGSIVPDHYIVVFHDDITAEQSKYSHGLFLIILVKKHWDWLHSKVSPALDVLHIQSEPFGLKAQSFLEKFDILHHYDFDNFKAYAAKLPSFIVKLLSVCVFFLSL